MTTPMTFPGMKYTPHSTTLEGGKWVDQVTISNDDLYSAPSGVSSLFLHNNASESNLREWGYKIFFDGEADMGCASDALCRQLCAYRMGVAPPCHRLIRVLTENSTLYGYTSGRASLPSVRTELSTNLRRAYEGYCRHRDCHIKWCIERGVATTDYPKLDINAYASSLGAVVVSGEELMHTLRNVEVLYPDGRTDCLGGDMHSDNFGYWKGKLVCIDFSFHGTELDEETPCMEL